jgi:hypothetical protein
MFRSQTANENNNYAVICMVMRNEIANRDAFSVLCDGINCPLTPFFWATMSRRNHHLVHIEQFRQLLVVLCIRQRPKGKKD